MLTISDNFKNLFFARSFTSVTGTEINGIVHAVRLS